jgi:chromosome segregation and condensation protein ScpB
MQTNQKLTNLQLELLKLFYQLSDTQLQEVKGLLTNYLAQNLSQAMGKLWSEQNRGNELRDEWANEHFCWVDCK